MANASWFTDFYIPLHQIDGTSTKREQGEQERTKVICRSENWDETMSIETATGQLNTSGLTAKEVIKQRHRYGENVLTPPKRASLWALYIDKYRDPIIQILLLAAAVSLVFSFVDGEFLETLGIFLAVILATTIGFYFERDAAKKFNVLTTLSEEQAVTVRREGETTQIPRREVVVGDVMVLEVGDEIPADGELLQSADLQIDESSLTGEPIITKHADPSRATEEATYPANIVLRSTMVMSGSGLARVISVGDNTEIGKVASKSTELTAVKTPLNQQLDRLAKLISKVGFGVALSAFIVFLGHDLFTQEVWHTTHYMQMIERVLSYFMMSVTLIVMTVPEGLPMAVTLSLALNMRRMLKSNNLVRKLHACETMGAVTVICTDKTGTLTTGTFQVEKTVGLSEEDMALVAAVEAVNSHPIAQAIVKSMQGKELIDVDKNQIENVPGYGMKYKTWLMGTLKLLKQEGVNYDEALESVAETIVAVAEDKLFKGYILLADTPKAGIFTLPKRLKAQGIKMMQVLSGDKQALIDRLVVQFEDAKDYVKGYGDLLPEHKVAHIEALKHDGREVAFIGDGINDAPVLALSNVGFAMGKMGADMAVETADVVIQTDEPLKVAEAIAIGRRTRRIVLQNIIFAIGVKVLVMVLGILGMATLWEAVFADSGVALLAVMNSMRALKK